MDTVDSIFSKYNTDKNRQFHNYSRQYESLFAAYRDKELSFLEIGVFHGESINAFSEVFANATRLVGVDINERCRQFENPGKRIYIEIGDATTRDFIDGITKKHGRFDLILDDGSHINRDVIKSFELLFPLLNDGGLYVVEDTICFKNPPHIDKNYPDHLTYFFHFTPFLNQWRFDSETGVKDHCVDPFKIMKKSSNPFECAIDKIEYGCSYIAISKKVRQHWLKEPTP